MVSGRHVSVFEGEDFVCRIRTPTFYLVVCSFFPMADIDKVKTRLGLCKTQRKVFKVTFAGQAAVPAHGLAEAGQVGIGFSNNFNLAGVAAALLKDSSPQGVGRLLTTVDTLRDKGFLKLERYMW